MKSKPLFGRRADWLAFIGTLAVFPMFLWLIERSQLSFAHVMLLYDMVLLYPHLLATVPVAFAESSWRRHPWSYIVTPCLLAGAVWMGWALGYVYQLVLLRFYWGLIHVAAQLPLMLHYHRRLNGFASSSRLWLELGVAIPGLVIAVQALARGRIVFPWQEMTSGLFDVHAPVVRVLSVVIAMGGSAMVILIIRDGCAGRPIAFPLGLWGAGVACVGMLAWVATDPHTFMKMVYLGLIGWHDAQYLAWTWVSHRNRLHHAGASTPQRRILYWIGLYGAAAICYLVGGPALFSALGISCLLVHFYLDHFIWYRREAYAWFGMRT